MNVYVQNPLIFALNILEPYPWKEHVELVLRNIWGRNLHEMKLAVENMHSIASRFNRPADVYLNGFSRRRVRVALPDKLTFHASASKSESFGIPYNLLLPTDLWDSLQLTKHESYETGSELAFVQPGTCVEFIASDSYKVVKNWMVGLHELATDLIDADRIMRRVAMDLKRTHPDVLRSVYSSALRVFPGMGYSKRPPISQPILRSVIHPDDQEMIRTVLDQAAGGMKLPHAECTLMDLRLCYYEEE